MAFPIILLFGLCFLHGNIFPIYAKEDSQKIKNIFIQGNKYIKNNAILKRLPYKVGDIFDASKSADAIKNVYALGRFNQVQLEKTEVTNRDINLYVTVTERKLLEDISLKGNKALKTKKIMEKLGLEKLETVDEEQLKGIVKAIKDLYKEENYHQTDVTFTVVSNEDNPDKASVLFTINDGPKAIVTRVYFVGNTRIPDRKLRTIVFTREAWILKFMDDSGKYSEEMLEMDKKRIEYFYRDAGYLMAKVLKADVVFSDDKQEIYVTFHIREGEPFRLRHVSIPSDDVYREDDLKPYLTMFEGEPFSQSKLVASLNALKSQWGNLGYIYADVYPQIIPNEETHEVDVIFHSEKGKKMHANRINITGNKATRDRVIRREIELEEGELITSGKLDYSKDRVEYLGFFERGGVNWKIHKLDDKKADLEMHVTEAKTGKANLQFSYGGDKDPRNSLKISGNLEKSNFLGRGWDIGAQIEANFHKARKASLFFFDPHIFDSNVSWMLNGYVKQEEYDQWHSLSRVPLEKTVGGSTKAGFMLPWLSRRTEMTIEVGAEYIENNRSELTQNILGPDKSQMRSIVNRSFQSGDNIWLAVNLIKDTRNHRVYPSRGFRASLGVKTAPGAFNEEFSYLKSEVEWSWYTPLIGEDWLVLMLHTKGGIVDSLSKQKTVPYKELFHMGGQGTVRGFTWGGIGPAWKNGSDPLGARKAVQFNAELIFPLIPDYSMKGHVFYDAGAGWDTPKKDIQDMSLVKRNKFKLRHSVGFGLNLLKPFPVKIDWGYKLDRDRKADESASEFHLSSNIAF